VAAKFKIADLKELGSRGGDNNDMSKDAMTEAVASFGVAKQEAEAEVGGKTFEWLINGESYSGRFVGGIQLDCGDTYGRSIPVKLVENALGGAVRSASFEVPCRYVRRGMWDLNRKERHRFFVAAKKLYQYDTEVPIFLAMHLPFN
jgi:hypothetical protein